MQVVSAVPAARANAIAAQGLHPNRVSMIAAA